MEIHQLNMSFTPDEVQGWLNYRETGSSLKISHFSGEEGGFTLQLKYKRLTIPVRLKLIEANCSLIRLEIISLPSLFSALPLNLFQSQGVTLKGRELWIDLVIASGGRLAQLDLEELSFHQDRITFKVRDLVIEEPFVLKHSS